MATVSCPNCGHPNADTAKFCAKCGQKLTPSETMVMNQSELLGSSAAPPPARPAPPAPMPAAAPPPMSAKEQAAYDSSPGTATFSPPPPPARPPVAPVPAAAAYSAPAAAAPAGESGHRYVAMRTIAGLCNILAWISAGLALLSGFFFGWQMFGGFLGLLAGLFIGAIAGALGWIYWRLLGEGIWLVLEIAANTRRTAAALENK